MSKTQKIISSVVLLVLIVGVGFYFHIFYPSPPPPIKYWTKNPTNFEECKEAARGLILKTLPAQCEFRGQNFVDQSQGQIGFLNNPSRQNPVSDQNFFGSETANWKIYTNRQYGFEFKYPAIFVLGQNPLINDWSKPIEEGPGAFWQKIAKNNWQERLTKKRSYKIGSLCTINADNYEESCEVISISPYVMKFVERTATGKVNTYRVISNSIEVVFGPVVPREGAVLDGASDQILATFRFTK